MFGFFQFSFFVRALVCVTLIEVVSAQDIASLDQLMDVRVQTVTLAKQTLREAPADVTVITAADIRRYGFRTLAEVLANVRGFYVTQDAAWQYAGVRGFSLLGDYNTRFIVMIDGHPLTENVYGSAYMFGQDFFLDMDLVSQIEIVRGPSSALYGSNGMFATINILTKKDGVGRTGRVSTEMGSFGETKALAAGTFAFGKSGSALVSMSGFHTTGREAMLAGTLVRGIGKERGLHGFANVSWNNWNFVTMFGDRKTAVPTGFFGGDIGDTATTARDSRNFAEVSWSRPIGDNKAIRWRAHYDQYRYDAVYSYLETQNLQNYDGAAGDWVGHQLVYQHKLQRFGSLTLGTEASFDLRNLQYTYYTNPSDKLTLIDEARFSHPNAGYAVFAQHEISLGSRFTVYAGGRLDDSKNNRLFLSPRLALIYKQAKTAYKLMYGRAFRNPSTFERYFEPSPDLQAERIDTIEFSREQALHNRVTLVTSVYHYGLRDLIGGVPVSDTRLQYRNTARAKATGAEVEIHGRPAAWLQAGGSFALQRTRDGADDCAFENSPERVAQFRAAVPLARERVVPAVALRYLSSRVGAYDYIVPSRRLVDLTLTSRRRGQGLDLQLGVRNLLNKRHEDPLSAEHATASLPRAGRTFFVKLTWQSE